MQQTRPPLLVTAYLDEPGWQHVAVHEAKRRHPSPSGDRLAAPSMVRSCHVGGRWTATTVPGKVRWSAARSCVVQALGRWPRGAAMYRPFARRRLLTGSCCSGRLRPRCAADHAGGIHHHHRMPSGRGEGVAVEQPAPDRRHRHHHEQTAAGTGDADRPELHHRTDPRRLWTTRHGV